MGQTGCVSVGAVIGLLRRVEIAKSHLEKQEVGHEVNVLKQLLYKNHNQHRRGLYFRKLLLVTRLFGKYERVDLIGNVKLLLQEWPSSKVLSKVNDLNELPRAEGRDAIVNADIPVLVAMCEKAERLCVACNKACEDAAADLSCMMAQALFLPFITVVFANISRINVLTKYLVEDVRKLKSSFQNWIDAKERGNDDQIRPLKVSKGIKRPAYNPDEDEDLGEPV
eukprot:Nk52_evm49s208 gene=Nk52_evmTU49s208